MSAPPFRFSAEANGDRLFIISLVLFALVYVCFYPKLYTSIDEASTFRMAYVLRHGTIFPYDSGFFPSISPLSPHGRVYRFLIGFPAVLAAASLFGWRALFLVNPALHIIAAWLFSRVLRAAQIPPVLAVLYLFYPSSVLFSRSLFSDIFAASLTTIALYFLLPGKKPLIAGLFLGLALASRSASSLVALVVAIFLVIDDWRDGRRTLTQSRCAAFVIGLAPFILVNMAYNDAIFGSPFKSTYTAGELSIANIRYNGPIYALSLGLIYPGMLLAPLFYRGWYWKPALVSSVLTLLLAAAFEETTYGNSILQNLLSAPRQALPAMPFFLLAYSGVLARLMPVSLSRRPFITASLAALLLVIAIVISAQHQSYLHRLTAIQTQIASALPNNSVIYANKDVYKLHQPQWDTRTYRELPFVNDSQAASDLRRPDVYALLFVRSRGFADEDSANAGIVRDLKARFMLVDGPALGDQLDCYRIEGLRPAARK